MARSYTATDPYAEARERANEWRKLVDRDMDPSNPLSTPLATSRKEFNRAQGSVEASSFSIPDYVTPKGSPFDDSAGLDQELGAQAVASAIDARGSMQIAKADYEAALDAAKEKAEASTGASILGAIGKVASAALPFAFCDVRLKTDIAPLERYEVDDELTELALAVQELREYS